MISSKIDAAVCYITLDRAEKRNALDNKMVKQLTADFTAAFANPVIKVIVLQANGEVFSAGADLAYLQKLQNNTFNENVVDSSALAALFQLIYEGPKVVIASVQGHAIAGGCGLATVCDFCIANNEAKFGYTEVKIGFIPAIVSFYLLRKIGETKAKELMLTGKLITADEATNWGMINCAVAPDELKTEVDHLAQQIITNCSAEALKMTKELIRTVPTLETYSAMEYAANMNATARATEDCKKGITAFLNKEKIQW